MQVAGFLQGPYKIKNFYSNVKCITSNKPPTGPYRGVGRPAAVFVIESLVDIAARKINMDPSQLRLKNIIQKNIMLVGTYDEIKTVIKVKSFK